MEVEYIEQEVLIPTIIKYTNLPAKSTRFIIEVLVIFSPASLGAFWVNVIATIVWALELVAFMFVAARVRFLVPSAILASIAA